MTTMNIPPERRLTKQGLIKAAEICNNYLANCLQCPLRKEPNCQIAMAQGILDYIEEDDTDHLAKAAAEAVMRVEETKSDNPNEVLKAENYNMATSDSASILLERAKREWDNAIQAGVFKFSSALHPDTEQPKSDGSVSDQPEPVHPKSDDPRQIEPSNVDHPTYYQGEYECIDLMREIYGDEAVRNFCIINAYKYRFRAGKKQGEPAKSDLDKADWYESYVMEHMPKNFEAWRDRMSEEVEKMCVDPNSVDERVLHGERVE